MALYNFSRRYALLLNWSLEAPGRCSDAALCLLFCAARPQDYCPPTRRAHTAARARHPSRSLFFFIDRHYPCRTRRRTSSSRP